MGWICLRSDADRLATMGENGQEISEEFTLALALDNLLNRKKSPVTTNLSTSMLIDDVAAKYGVNVIRSKIGEANVVEEMEKHDCLYGGEGNGGVIFPEISYALDGLCATADSEQWQPEGKTYRTGFRMAAILNR